MQTTRNITWTDARCAGCDRPAYVRRDGRAYLYLYPNLSSAAVCSPRCAKHANDTLATEHALRASMHRHGLLGTRA